MAVCSSCGEATLEAANFCPACGARFGAPGAHSHERKLITAVFVDLADSAQSGHSVDPEDLAARLVPYSQRVLAALQRHGGTLEKFVGDAVVAVFGAPVAHEDDALRAVRGALAAFEAIARLNAEDESLDLKIRIGVTTGEALVALNVSARSGAAVAVGDVMNTAARLQAAAPVNAILVGEATFRATRDFVGYRHARPIQAKGKSQPLEVWEVIGLRRSDSRGATAFVGRNAELGQLADLWDLTRAAGRHALAAIVGPPGIGKTRLLSELANRAASGGAVLWGRCPPQGEGIGYWPVSEMVDQAAGVQTGDPPSTVRTKLEAFAERLVPAGETERQTIASALAAVCGAQSETDLSDAELQWSLCRVFALLSAERPLLIVVEDLHWADERMLALLERMSLEEDAPYLIAASARGDAPDAVRPIIGQASLVLRLDPLTDEESERLLAGLVGAAESAGATGDAVRAKARGNPLFLEETARMLADLGQWRPEAVVDAIPVPDSLRALLGSRLDQLHEEEKRLAQYASVVGEAFEIDAARHLLGDLVDREAFERAIAGLEQADLLRVRRSPTDESGHSSFKHVLVRDVAYDQLPKSTRIELHTRYAGWLRRGDAHGRVELVAWHLERACRLAEDVTHGSVAPPIREAVTALSLAGEEAKRREGWSDASRFLGRAAELAEDDQALEVRVGYAGALIGLGDVDRATELSERAKKEALEVGDLQLASEAAVTLCHAAQRQGRAVEARQRVDELEQLASRSGDRRLELRARLLSSSVKAEMEGAPDAAAADLLACVAMAEEIQDLPLLVEGQLRMGIVSFNMGELARAEAALERCVTLAAEMGNRRDEARASCALAAIKYLRGDTKQAEQTCEEVENWLARSGETFFQIQNLIVAGRCARAGGDLERAETRLRSAFAIALDEDNFLGAEVSRLLVETLIDRGRLGEASELASFAARRVQHGHPYALAARQLAESALARAAGDVGSSLTCIEAAVAALEDLGLPIDLNEARLFYGRTLREIGAVDDAQAQFELVRDDCARMGALRLVVEAGGELASMTDRAASGPTTS